MPAGRIILLGAMCLVLAGEAWAQQAPEPAGDSPQAATDMPGLSEVFEVVEKAAPAGSDEQGQDWSAPVRLAVVFTLLALLPSLLVMVTSFTRVVIVLAFVRRALTTQNVPPTIAIIGLALFLTLFIMGPVFSSVNTQAVQPYLSDQITFPAAMARGEVVFKEFMIHQMDRRPEDLATFVDLAGIEPPEYVVDLPTHVVVPAFAISEFRRAFEMGALLFIPFLLIDLVVASILLSTGMMMLPPAMISLPFKIILFVLVDGWRLLAEALVKSFHWAG